MNVRFGKISHARSRRAKDGAYPMRGRGPYEAPCPHYPHCIGCPLINFPYPEQLIKKRQIVVQALSAYRSLVQTQVPAVIASP